MRAILFITYLLTSLLIGGNKMHATTHTIASGLISNFNITYKVHNKFLHSKRGHSSQTIINKDFDLNEEYSSNDHYKNAGDTKIVNFKQTLFTRWYLSDDNSYITAFPYNRFYFTKPISGQSTPIYITQRVLRI